MAISRSTTLTDLQASRMPNACPKCGGCGKLDDKDNLSWARFQKARSPEVAAGLIQPVTCPDCQGVGYSLEEPKAAPSDAATPAPAAAEEAAPPAEERPTKGKLPLSKPAPKKK